MLPGARGPGAQVPLALGLVAQGARLATEPVVVGQPDGFLVGEPQHEPLTRDVDDELRVVGRLRRVIRSPRVQLEALLLLPQPLRRRMLSPPADAMNARLWPWLLLAVCVIVLDQSSKALVVASLEPLRAHPPAARRS